MTTRRRSWRTRVLVALGGFVALVLVAAAGFVAWTAVPWPVEEGPLAAVASDAGVDVVRTADGVVLSPRGPATGDGVVFFPGWKIDAESYAWKLSGVVEAGTTVVLVRSPLNLAILDGRPLSRFTAAAPGVTRWFVGGHSLGGLRASQYAGEDEGGVAGLLLLGAYSLVDLSDRDLPVLSLSAQNDGLFTRQALADRADLLPPSAARTEVPGANHAQFGDYGPQPGDGPSGATDAAVRDAITAAVGGLLAAAR